MGKLSRNNTSFKVPLKGPVNESHSSSSSEDEEESVDQMDQQQSSDDSPNEIIQKKRKFNKSHSSSSSEDEEKSADQKDQQQSSDDSPDEIIQKKQKSKTSHSSSSSEDEEESTDQKDQQQSSDDSPDEIIQKKQQSKTNHSSSSSEDEEESAEQRDQQQSSDDAPDKENSKKQNVQEDSTSESSNDEKKSSDQNEKSHKQKKTDESSGKNKLFNPKDEESEEDEEDEEDDYNPYQQPISKNLNWEADLSDPLALKKMIDFTKSMHGPSNFYSHDIFKIKYKGKEVGRLQTHSEVKSGGKFIDWSPNYAYAFGPETDNTKKPLTYAEIGLILSHYNPKVLTQIADLALKLFRSRPINIAVFDELFMNKDFKVKIIDKNIKDKLKELSKNDLERLQIFIDNPQYMFAQLIGAMACEAGRGYSGLENFVATLHIIKHWNTNKELLTSYGIPKTVQKKTLNEAILNDIFPDNKGNIIDKKLETRIAVGHSGSQEQIRVNSGEKPKQDKTQYANNSVTDDEYKQMLKRDNDYLSQIDTQREYKKNKWQEFSDNNIERKFNRHAKTLYGAPLNTILQDIKDYIKEEYYDDCAKLVKDWLGKNYLSQFTFSEITNLFTTILDDKKFIKSKEPFNNIVNDLLNHIQKTEPKKAEILITLIKSYEIPFETNKPDKSKLADGDNQSKDEDKDSDSKNFHK